MSKNSKNGDFQEYFVYLSFGKNWAPGGSVSLILELVLAVFQPVCQIWTVPQAEEGDEYLF